MGARSLLQFNGILTVRVFSTGGTNRLNVSCLRDTLAVVGRPFRTHS